MNTYEFDIPTALNGEQLKNELQAEDVYVREDKLIIIGDMSKESMKSIIANHVPIPPVELTIQEKLASVGLSLEELRTALGSN